MLGIWFSIAIFIILLYINYIYKKYTKVIPFILLYIFELVWILFSCIYIENGTYIS